MVSADCLSARITSSPSRDPLPTTNPIIDRQYGNEPLNFEVGEGLVEVYREFGGDFRAGTLRSAAAPGHVA